MSYRQKYTDIHTDFAYLDHRCFYLCGKSLMALRATYKPKTSGQLGLKFCSFNTQQLSREKIAFCCWSHRRVRRVQLCLEIGSISGILACTCRDLKVHCQVQGSPPDCIFHAKLSAAGGLVVADSWYATSCIHHTTRDKAIWAKRSPVRSLSTLVDRDLSISCF